jgi:hypothetical protein
MDLEFVALTGVIIVALIFITESTRMIGLGLIAGVLFLFLAYWIYGSSIQVNVGYNLTTTQNSTFNATTNETSAITSQIATPAYAPLPITPYVDMTTILAFIFMLCGLYSIVHYSVDVIK